jgi:hypothetical protein
MAELTEQQRSLLSYCEQQWFLHGRLPVAKVLCEKFKLKPSTLNEWLQSEIFKLNFEARGIPTIHANELTAEQTTVINAMLNLSDTRSERKKLSDLNISARTWEGWKRDPVVMEYMRERSEQILAGAIPDAHLALVDKVRAGDITALKFFYEMTGRYTGQTNGMDPRALLTKVFDIIAKHVTQPEVLQAIATEFQLLAGVDRVGSIKKEAPVAGQIVSVADSPPQF